MEYEGIYYVEPNEEITFNNEDFSIGIKLEVDIPTRMLEFEGSDKTKVLSRGIEGQVNLFGGEDGYLTTSYGDVMSMDITDGGNKQSIGIENIQIKYTSWFYPEVNVKFIDLRGNSIMNPMENNSDGRGKASFLNALFTFPYPEFKLTVKGQYGKPVMYRLAVQDVRAAFNDSTGNFEFNVKFIGYMYGFLTDLPVRYAMISPYINYGGSGVITNNFKSGEGKIPNILDFLKKLNEIEVAKTSSEDIGQLRSQMSNKELGITHLDRLKNAVNWLNKDIVERLGTYFIISDNETGLFFMKKTNLSSDINIGNVKRDHINKHLKNATDAHSLYAGLKNIPDTASITNTDLSILKIVNIPEDNENFQLNFKYEDDIKTINETIGKLNNSLSSDNKDMDGKLQNLYSSSLGFKPSIGNIFQIVLAHVNKFEDVMRKCMGNIKKNEKKRNLSKIKTETDCRTNGTIATVPPFPLLFNGNKQYIYLTESNDSILKKFDEGDLVEHTLSGATKFSAEMGAIADEFDYKMTWANFPKEGLPTLLSDLLPNIARVNPYAANGGYNAQKENLPYVLGKRMFLRYYFNKGGKCQLDGKLFGEVEALNFYNAIGSSHETLEKVRKEIKEDTLTSDIRNFLNSFLNGFDDYIGGLSIGENEFSKPLSYGYNEYVKLPSKDKDGNITKLKDEIEKDSSIFKNSYSKCKLTKQKYLVFENGTYKGDTLSGYSEKLPKYEQFVKQHCGEGYGNVFSYNLIDSSYVWGHAKSADKNSGFYEIEGAESFKEGEGVKLDDSKYKQKILVKDYDTYESYFRAIDFDKVNAVYTANKLSSKDSDNDVLSRFFNIILGVVPVTTVGVMNGMAKIPKIIMLLYGYKLENRYHENNSFIKFVVNYFREQKSSLIEEIRSHIYKEIRFEKEVLFVNTVYYLCLSKNTREWLKKMCSMDDCVEVCVLHGESYLVNKKPIVIRDILGNTDSNAANNGETQNISSIVKGFVDKIKKLCDDELGPEKEDETNNNLELNKKSTNEKKLSIYMTYKQLYDRWKLGVTDNKTMKYENFRFFDSYYNDVSNEYMVNVDSFAALIRDVLDGHNDMSIYAFLWEICKLSNFNLLALPVNIYEALSSKEKMMEVFTPYTYMSVDNAYMDTTYIAMYTHKESSHLNITDPYNMYEDDGLDFLKNGIVNKTNKNVPVFGVTYSMGNQRIFNRITVNMDAPKVTAHSIMAELMISRQGANSGSQPIGFEGHDIFETYANKSYSCSVEMLGCAQIMPLMYFQLNNIPMFKGGYMITNVEHEISNGTMKTKFSGVRMNKNRFKISKDKQIFNENVLEAYLKNRKKGEDGGSGGSDGGGSSAGPHPKRGVYEKRTFGDAVKVTNPNLNGVKYSKENTLIIIDAGHHAKRKKGGKRSPQFDFKEVWPNKNASYIGDVKTSDPYGIMNPLNYVNGNFEEVYKNTPTDTNGLSGSGKYLEYWGNRKLALKLKNKLEANGYKVAMATKNMGRTSGAESGYQKHVTKLWEDNNKNAIVVSFHSNAGNGAGWSTANYWSIFCQHADEYVIKDKDWASCPPNADASYVLAANIIKAAKEKFTQSEISSDVFTKIDVKSSPKIYLASEEGVRPLTSTKPPAVMSENWFYTSKEGVEFLGSQKGEDLIVDVHYKGIQNFFDECNNLPTSVATPEATQTPVDAEKATGNGSSNNNSTPLPAQTGASSQPYGGTPSANPWANTIASLYGVTLPHK